MAYNTVSIKKDVDGKPIPQYYNPEGGGQYEPLEGRDGANKVELYSEGSAVDVATETKQDALNTLIGEMKTFPEAQSVLGRLKAVKDEINTQVIEIKTLFGEKLSSPTANTLLGRIKNLEDEISALNNKIDEILSMELYGATIDDRPAANTVRAGATFTIVSTEQTWMSDGIEWEEK